MYFEAQAHNAYMCVCSALWWMLSVLSHGPASMAVSTSKMTAISIDDHLLFLQLEYECSSLLKHLAFCVSVCTSCVSSLLTSVHLCVVINCFRISLYEALNTITSFSSSCTILDAVYTQWSSAVATGTTHTSQVDPFNETKGGHMGAVLAVWASWDI